jgi:methyl-accepting chemotaxis protein
VNEVTRITWGALAASALAISAIGFFLSRRIAGPVEAAATAVEKMGEGDFSQRVDAVGQDELARLGKALNATMVRSARRWRPESRPPRCRPSSTIRRPP